MRKNGLDKSIVDGLKIGQPPPKLKWLSQWHYIQLAVGNEHSNSWTATEILISIFSNSSYEGAQCILCGFSGDAKLGGVRTAIQKDHETLEA